VIHAAPTDWRTCQSIVAQASSSSLDCWVTRMIHWTGRRAYGLGYTEAVIELDGVDWYSSIMQWFDREFSPAHLGRRDVFFAEERQLRRGLVARPRKR
jgi:hypothetical protein